MAKRIFVAGFVLAVAWSTAIVFAQEQVPAPSYKDGDTWRFNISRKGGIGTSTEQNEGLYEVVVNQAVVKLYQVDGDQKNELSIKPDGQPKGYCDWLEKVINDLILNFPYRRGKNGLTSL